MESTRTGDLYDRPPLADGIFDELRCRLQILHRDDGDVVRRGEAKDLRVK
jgi:hypothetical protein